MLVLARKPCYISGHGNVREHPVDRVPERLA